MSQANDFDHIIETSGPGPLVERKMPRRDLYPHFCEMITDYGEVELLHRVWDQLQGEIRSTPKEVSDKWEQMLRSKRPGIIAIYFDMEWGSSTRIKITYDTEGHSTGFAASTTSAHYRERLGALGCPFV